MTFHKGGMKMEIACYLFSAFLNSNQRAFQYPRLEESYPTGTQILKRTRIVKITKGMKIAIAIVIVMAARTIVETITRE